MPSQELHQLRHLEAITETLLRTIRGLIAAREAEHRRRRSSLVTVVSLPVAAAAIGLARKWPHVSSAIGGAMVTGGAVAFVLVPQIGNGSAPARPDSDVDRPPIAAPARVTAPPHARSQKGSPLPGSRTYIVGPPASTPTVIPSTPVPTAGLPTRIKHHGRPTVPGKPTDLPGKPHPPKPPKCRGGLLDLFGLLCDRNG